MSLRQAWHEAWRHWEIVAVCITVGWLLVLTFYVQGLRNPVGNLPLIGGDTVERREIVVPLSPGLQSAERVCKEGAIQSREAMVEPPDGRIEYVAELGADLLYWVDSGANRNALLNGQGIVLSDEVMKCFRPSP